MIENPHFAFPFNIHASGRVVEVEQDSPDEIAAAVATSMRYPVGSRDLHPSFGRPLGLNFSKGDIDAREIAAAVAHSEPRAPLAVEADRAELEEALTKVSIYIGSEV